ncbi:MULTISPECIES: hypothetical protein [Halorussus]|uniref:hypothetical protein n=1 Tax=Halorussus TaxID=1070314 RepID=UPI0020A0D17A|nr:hypothetical protein [Halorussus vallis]USZ78032.1 hypothetical protein NGM07_20430 [Halorussus vallis]
MTFDERPDSLDDAVGDAEAPERRIERVRRCELPGGVAALVDAYEKTVGERDRFLWRWLYFVFPAVTLSCVDSTDEERVRDRKLLASLYVVLLDDVAERRMDRATFEELGKVPFDHRTPRPDREGVDADVVGFGERVWSALETDLETAPRAEEFRSLFEFDVKQNVNAVDYSYTVNQRLEMANLAETDAYDPNNMMLFTYATVDLMHAPSFDRDDLSALRRMLFEAQEMARIGNWVTTWERELREGDYSSGVVVYALENDIVDREELYKLSAGRFEAGCDDLVERIRTRGVEEHFLDEWHRRYEAVEAFEGDLDSVDVRSFRSGMEKVLSYQLASRGLK